MSRDDSRGRSENGGRETHHPPTADTSPIVSVASAIAAARDEAPTDLVPPLESVVDTDSIRSLIEEGEDDEVRSFRYRDCSVEVYGSGRIVVDADRPRLPRCDVPDRIRQLVEDRYVPGTGAEQAERRRAILAAYSYLRGQGSARRSDFIREVYPCYPGEYSIPDGGWWETVVKPGLGACPDVAKGNAMWYYVGD
ncbi:HalOD1 output domain-containing protein [Halalkalicoccus tibetensis]|uniref:HalOD1 output domain-containing protein n=1 Tax=Halalkalicoccus tibetensis TaxID=175632 RepID=A0ABD5V461_9EURY